MRHFLSNVRRVLHYLPLIWNTRDYDYIFAVDVFTHQLRRQRDYFRVHGNLEDASLRAQQIETALNLFDKVYNESYTNWHDEVTNKWGDDILEFDSVEQPDGTTTLEFGFRHHPNKEQIEQDIRDAQRRGMDKHNRAHKLLWDYIEHHIQTWWD